jgi:hypothetical protein
VRIRIAMIAAVVALIAVVAGAQAASGEQSSSSSLPSGDVVPVKSHSLPGSLSAKPMSPTGTRTHRGNDNIAGAASLTSSVNGSVCRAPSVCFLSDDNAGATTEAGENVNCPPAFDSTVWYRFSVTKAGLLDVIINNTEPGGFIPVLGIYNGNTGSGFCGAASTTTTNFADTFEAGPGTTLGSTVFIQVGATLAGSAGGTFDLNLSWDPDTDGDNITDSGDRCDNARGPASLRGCPDGDGDRVVDIDDACPGTFGTFLRGCPDADGDGNAEGINDACPGQKATRDANNNGCQDLAKFDFGAPPLPYTTLFNRNGRRNGFKITGSLKVTDLPKGTVVRLKCSKKKTCRKLKKKKRAGSRGRVSFKLKGRKLRPGQSISIRATHAGYVGKYISWKAKKKGKKGYTRKTRCSNPGSSKLLRCSKVNVIR